MQIPQLENSLKTNSSSLVWIPLDDLSIPKRQLRLHPKSQIKKIAESLEKFGCVAPILVDQHNNVVAGVARIRAARLIGLQTILAVRIEHLTDEEIHLYRIADNRLAEDSDWNSPELKLEFEDLIVLGQDITITGFDQPETDIILSDGSPAPDRADEIRAVDTDTVPVTRLGDTWQVGAHRIHCGDAQNSAVFSELLGGEEVKAVFTDPPYNVSVASHIGGLGRHKHREFVMASGEMSPELYSAFLKNTVENAVRSAIKGAVLFVCIDWRSSDTLKRAADAIGLEALNLCVWNKTNGTMGSLYRSKHELIWVFRVPGAGHTNNVQLGKHGRNRSNVCDYPGANTPGSDSNRDLALHPTIKPVALIADAIRDVTNRGDIVLDIFGGVGSTLLAAERTGRQARLIELDPCYVDAALHRIREHTGLCIHLKQTGQSFDKVSVERRGPAQYETPNVSTRYRPRRTEATQTSSNGGNNGPKTA